MLTLLVVTASNFVAIIMLIVAYIPTIFHIHILDLTFSCECSCCSPLVMTSGSLVGGHKILDENIGFNFHTEDRVSMIL